jgi:glycolate oxidase FAD binding subunit
VTAAVRDIHRVTTPGNIEEACAALALAAARHESVAFMGGGTELGLGAPPRRVDVLVRSARLNRVVDYEPADLIVAVEAGVTLHALQTLLAPHGQRLAFDPPLPELATLGGLMATNAYGPLRTRFGTLRDLVVGASFVRADGRLARGGGKVVKNVAGFDLPKLLIGSLGTLGMIATVTLRVHPLPESAKLVRVSGCDAAGVRALRNALLAEQLEPSALLAERSAGRYDVYASFEGFESGVDEQATRFVRLASGLGHGADALPSLRPLAALDEGTRTYGTVRLRLAVRPSDLERMEREAIAPLERAFGDAKIVVYPAFGTAFVCGYAEDPSALADAIRAARGALEAAGGNLVVSDVADRTATASVDRFGAPPAALGLMRGLKERFDPEQRLNPGRFVGGI